MIENVDLIVGKYLERFSDEKEKLVLLIDYLKRNSIKDALDWNNKNGHITVGAFVYCKCEDKFLVLYHKDLKMYLYPGGHIDKGDKTLFDASKRELKEETGLKNLETLLINNEVLPFDIDTHIIPDNNRINMPSHYHFDFRYLFFIDDLKKIILDEEECQDYKWINSDELINDKNYGNIVNKLKNIVRK